MASTTSPDAGADGTAPEMQAADGTVAPVEVRPPAIRVDSWFMRQRLSHMLALGFGSGLSPVAPGTVGTAWAWLAWVALGFWFDEVTFAGLVVLAFAVGVWACARTSAHLGVHDHRAIVWDEIAAFWLVLLFTPPVLAWQAAAFVLFRFFDIVKPPPIRWCDRHLGGGFGIMFDDFLAALFTMFVLAAAVAGWFW